MRDKGVTLEKSVVTIKGTREGLLVLLDEEPSNAVIMRELGDRLLKGDRFFRSARVTVSIGGRTLERDSIDELMALLASYDMSLEGIATTNEENRALMRGIGIRRVLLNPRYLNDRTSQPIDSGEALFVRRTLRSGVSLRHHADIIVVGDVNAGAEVVAGGDVVIWGSVRGAIFAGVPDKEGAVIAALHLEPTQLGIGSLVSRSPESPDISNMKRKIVPEVARQQDGKIIIEDWEQYRNRV